ncbi:ABC transporter substrate-binding protein [Lentzea tibetensis]|uniref:ABC transporter substrate-binding protein n=1 Tax=Lentzea tibetensis TaxID=2591470 RepID=A0A563EP14_9PSEU|nr:ABC transporter substrate-binding protein [Lentzea tibetensis]TWP48423.1 ABC transporter substrate-binding protein [Lentzea tibetensis]
MSFVRKLLTLAGATLVATGLVAPAVQTAAVADQHGFQNTVVRMFNTEPFRPLLPGDTNEWGGGRLISMMFTGLVGYRLEDAAPYNAMAKSIETKDSKVFRIKIHRGWKFHDGSEVKARNFVNAWNHVAYGPNKLRNNTFMERIQGYADLNPASGTPTTDKLSGLKIINDYEFQVTLSVPLSIFPTMVGYWAFYPLPDSFFRDQEAWKRKPVGNGPYKFVEAVPNGHQKLTAFKGFKGEEKPRIKDLHYTVYPNTSVAYDALVRGELDFMEAMPYEKITSGQYKKDLPGRFTDRNFLLMQNLAFPSYKPGYDNPDLRKAVSMSIDRAELIKKVGGGQKAADGFTIPGLEGYAPGQCGELCTYNPAKARELFARTGFQGPIELHTNVESGARTWLGPVCESIKTTLGVDCVTKETMSFREFREAIVGKRMTGAYRSDWRADYPSIENFLTPLYKTGASSNDYGYSNPAFDAALDKADRAPSKEAALGLYRDAERLLVQDMPVVPLWQEWSAVGWSPRLRNVKVSVLTDIDIFKVRVVEPCDR